MGLNKVFEKSLHSLTLKYFVFKFKILYLNSWLIEELLTFVFISNQKDSHF